MATETFILRPVSGSNLSTAEKITYYPADTTPENSYLLISEEIADDDSTYIETANYVLPYMLVFNEPVGYVGKTPISFKIICRALVTNVAHTAAIIYRTPNNGSSFGTATNIAITDYKFSAVNSYENIVVDFTSDMIAAAWEVITQYPEDGIICGFRAENKDESSSKEATVRVTQFYVEVTYEENTDPGGDSGGDNEEGGGSEEVVPTSTTLRPVQVKDYTGTTINFNPADTTIENAHTLINEEVLDETTEIGVTSGEKITIVYDYKKTNNICGMKHILSLKSFLGILQTYIIEFNIFDVNSQLISNETITVSGYEAKVGYVDTIAISSDAFMALNTIEEGTIEVVFLSGTEPSTTHGKDIYAFFSQAYIELSFPTYESIYIHENNSWTKLTGKVYQKQNGTWQECGTGILLEGSAKVIT